MPDLPPELTEEQIGHGRTAEALRDLAGDISEGIEVGRAGDDNEILIIWPAENIKDVLHRAADLIEELSLATINPQGPQAAALIERLEAPIPMILHCPECHLQHIDAPDERTPEWTNPPHKSHLCHGCGTIWRPATVPTEGVATIATRGKSDTWPARKASKYLAQGEG